MNETGLDFLREWCLAGLAMRDPIPSHVKVTRDVASVIFRQQSRDVSLWSVLGREYTEADVLMALLLPDVQKKLMFPFLWTVGEVHEAVKQFLFRALCSDELYVLVRNIDAPGVGFVVEHEGFVFAVSVIVKNAKVFFIVETRLTEVKR
jgi:hypothetical protein